MYGNVFIRDSSELSPGDIINALVEETGRNDLSDEIAAISKKPT